MIEMNRSNIRNDDDINNMAWRMRRYIDKYDNSWNYARESAFDDWRSENPEKRKEFQRLWSDFGTIPTNPETECIEEEWNDFPIGTHREEIWHWFEDIFGVPIMGMMYEKEEA